MRLLWPAAAPSGVSATDHTELNAEVESFYAECPPLTDHSVLLVDLDGDVVTRTVHIRPTGGWHDVDPPDDARLAGAWGNVQ